MWRPKSNKFVLVLTCGEKKFLPLRGRIRTFLLFLCYSSAIYSLFLPFDSIHCLLNKIISKQVLALFEMFIVFLKHHQMSSWWLFTTFWFLNQQERDTVKFSTQQKLSACFGFFKLQPKLMIVFFLNLNFAYLKLGNLSHLNPLQWISC